MARCIFPSKEIINGRQVDWAVHREPFLGPDGKEERDKPDAIIVRSLVVRKNAPQMQDREFDRYNWLIIEASPPAQDTPEGWKELLMRVCSRVRQYDNGSHDVYILCVVGLKYMPFYWDPKNADNPAQQLRLDVSGEEVLFLSQLRPAQDCSPHLPNLKADRAPDQYRIDLTRVWGADPGQLDASGQAMEPLTALETFIMNTRTTPLQNPTHPIA